MRAEHAAYCRGINQLAAEREELDARWQALADQEQGLFFTREKMLEELRELKAERKMVADERRGLRADREHYLVDMRTANARQKVVLAQQDALLGLANARLQEENSFARGQEGRSLGKGKGKAKEGKVEVSHMLFTKTSKLSLTADRMPLLRPSQAPWELSRPSSTPTSTTLSTSMSKP